MISWKRANLPLCTDQMLDVLKRLRAAKEAERPFISLDDVHGNCLRALQKRDWIVRSLGVKGDRANVVYSITGRGLKACSIYEVPPGEYDQRRWDNICCRCGEHERGTYATGRRKPYCDACLKKIAKRRHDLFGYQKNPGLCPACGIRQKHVMASGQVRSYCKPCRRKHAKQYREEKYKREYARVMAGEVLLCYRCHKRPRWLTGHTLQDYWFECSQSYKRQRRMLQADA